jgi:hypothetical protein
MLEFMELNLFVISLAVISHPVQIRLTIHKTQFSDETQPQRGFLSKILGTVYNIGCRLLAVKLPRF